LVKEFVAQKKFSEKHLMKTVLYIKY